MNFQSSACFIFFVNIKKTRNPLKHLLSGSRHIAGDFYTVQQDTVTWDLEFHHTTPVWSPNSHDRNPVDIGLMQKGVYQKPCNDEHGRVEAASHWNIVTNRAKCHWSSDWLLSDWRDCQ